MVDMAKNLKTKYLIIGNSAGGIGAAEAIREVDTAGSIAIVSDESYPAYSRPLISKYLSKERDLEGMLYRPPDFYTKNDIKLITGKSVTGLDLAKHTARLESGGHIAWDKLLIASGGMPIVPEIAGLDKRGVFNFMTLDDAKDIDEFLTNDASAVVIGGGLIGISVTEALVKRGVSVTVVEMKDRILNTVLDETASAMAAQAVESAGVSIIADNTVAEVRGDEFVSGVILESGEAISCSLLVIAIGVLPRTDVARDTDVEVNHGIVVNRNMLTSNPDVYACGDAAEAYDFVYRANRAIPIWPSAYIGGRVAGFNMAGAQKEYPGSTAMNSLSYFGVDIVSAGIVTPPDTDDYEILSAKTDSIYKKLILRGDIILGMTCIGDIDKAGILYSLLRDGINVAEFKHKLLDDDFGLVSMPKKIWQERLETPPPIGVVSPKVPPEEEVEDYAGE